LSEAAAFKHSMPGHPATWENAQIAILAPAGSLHSDQTPEFVQHGLKNHASKRQQDQGWKSAMLMLPPPCPPPRLLLTVQLLCTTTAVGLQHTCWPPLAAASSIASHTNRTGRIGKPT
jgi:hypothetical protein